MAADPFGTVASADAHGQYGFMVMPVGAGLVLNVRLVPVIFSANVAASASGTGNASAQVQLGGVDSNGHPILGVETSECAPDSCAAASNFSNRIALSLATGIEYTVILTARGFARADDVQSGNGGSFQAAADPVVTISDELVPGTNINFRDAFSVVIDPTVTQSLGTGGNQVPEPATAAPMGAALLAVGMLLRRGGTRSRRANRR